MRGRLRRAREESRDCAHRPLRPRGSPVRQRVREPHHALAQEHRHEHRLHAERVDFERHVVDLLAHHAREAGNRGALEIQDGHAARPGLHEHRTGGERRRGGEERQNLSEGKREERRGVVSQRGDVRAAHGDGDHHGRALPQTPVGHLIRQPRRGERAAREHTRRDDGVGFGLEPQRAVRS